jgi:hypothetical protein
MKKIVQNNIGWIVLFVLLVILMIKPIVLLLLAFLLIIFIIISHYLDTREQRKFMKEYNGKVFYLYSSKKLWLKYNTDYVLPILGKDISKVYNHKGKIHADFPLAYFSSFYYQVDKLKHPLFLKIIDNKAIGVSIYDDLVDLKVKKTNAGQFQKQLKQKLKNLEKQSQ